MTKKRKVKTLTSAARRFRVTKTGKVLYRSQNMRHLKRHKSKRSIRRARAPKQLTGRFAIKIKRLLGQA